MKTNIIVNLQVEGIHQWSECPIPEMAFLKSPHRHIFHFKIEKGVEDLDREIEIIKFKREVSDYINAKFFTSTLKMCDFGNMSCEQIGKLLLDIFHLYSIEVLEDNENGSKTYRFY